MTNGAPISRHDLSFADEAAERLHCRANATFGMVMGDESVRVSELVWGAGREGAL